VTFVVRPAGADRWADVERVLRMPGEPSECWCQFFRFTRDEFGERSHEANEENLRRLVEEGLRPGLVAYDGDDPVGWCAVAPISSLPRIARSPFFADIRPDDDDPSGRWAVTCFVVREGARGLRLVDTLLAAAADFARDNGATGIEAYPLDTNKAEEVTPDNLFGGTVTAFESAGFTHLADLGPDRAIMVQRF
jgi:GNAT superfamily N-acetyltransferase